MRGLGERTHCVWESESGRWQPTLIFGQSKKPKSWIWKAQFLPALLEITSTSYLYILVNNYCKYIHTYFWDTPATSGKFRARDQTCVTAATWAAAVTTPDLNVLCHKGVPKYIFNSSATCWLDYELSKVSESTRCLLKWSGLLGV